MTQQRKYGQLVSFDAIESVLKLKDADTKDRAKDHARTFVTGSNLRKQLGGTVFAELQFAKPTAENRGVFIVGNYGTGKTHLMSVVSAVCEHSDVRPDDMKDKDFAAAMDPCQGKFKVVRITIGSTLKAFRDSPVATSGHRHPPQPHRPNRRGWPEDRVKEARPMR